MKASEDYKSLIIKYLTHEATREEVLSLAQWLKLDANNEELFIKLKTSWALSNNNVQKPVFDVKNNWNKIQQRIQATEEGKPQKSVFVTFLRIASLWVLLFGLGCLFTYLLFSKNKPVGYNGITEISAPLGAKSIVILPDGTKVWLNAGSKLTYDNNFNLKERSVQLIGEAYFKVKTNANKPFIVNTSDLKIRALGTRFNVKAYPDEKTITATLEEGKIDVQMIGKNESSKKILLKPNENVVIYKEPLKEKIVESHKENLVKKEFVVEDKLEIETDIKTELYTSWKEDRWIIDGEPLATLVPKLERKFNLKINFSNDELKHYKFTGSIQNETIEQIIKAISYTAPIDFSVQRDTITLTLNSRLKEKYKKLITHFN